MALEGSEVKGHLVLIAEDDPLTRWSLRLLLEQEGYRCLEAADGFEAVKLAQGQTPGCVLLDLVMPGLDGVEVARQLRADARTSTAPIHCVTGVSDPAVHEQARLAGCGAVLLKPVDPEALLRVVRGETPRRDTDSVSGLTLADAEGLLDWLENQGCTNLEIDLDERGVTVRCVCPPGFRLVQDESGAVHLTRSQPVS